MKNKGKPWLPEHDVYLSENIAESNEQLADELGRSAYAVECRRVSLAVALSEKDPSMSLDQCISHYRADMESTKRRLDHEGNVFVMKKKTKKTKKLSIQGLEKEDTIAQVAECIRLNEGDMSAAWANTGFVSAMIRNHSGFEAYAAFVRGRGEFSKK